MPEPAAGQSWPEPGYRQSGYRQQAPGYGPARAPRHRASPPRAAGPLESWQLILTPGAKRLVGLILALGLLTVAGASVSAGASVNAAIQRNRAISSLSTAIASHDDAVAREQKDAGQVNRARSQLRAAYAKLSSALTANGNIGCDTISCFDATNRADGRATAAFGRAVRAIAFPAGAAAAANKLVRAVTADKAAWMYLSRAVSFTDGVNRAARAESAGKKVDQHYSALVTLLRHEVTELKRLVTALDLEAAALTRRAAALNVPVTVPISRPS